MAADGKWIDGLEPSMPVAKAADRTFTARLETVVQRCQDAAERPDEPESVHQLRVATRRAAAALRVFGDLARPGAAARMKKQLRKIRRAAGAVRDLDVFVQRLQERLICAAPSDRPGLDFLAGLALNERATEADQLLAALKRGSRHGIKHLNAHGARRTSLHDRAGEVVPELRERFKEASAANMSNLTALHATRIAGKRLRYALELFDCCFAQGKLERPLALLEELQDTLGTVHDADVMASRVRVAREAAERHLGENAQRLRPGLERWHAALETVAASGAEQFRAWSSRWRELAGEIEIAN